jgi:ubiquinone biosynthesis protein
VGFRARQQRTGVRCTGSGATPAGKGFSRTMIVGLGQRYKHLHRYREIIQVMVRHGFGNVVDQLGLQRYLSLPRRALKRGTAREEKHTTPQHLRLAIEELGPTFIKAGHILSTRPDLLPLPYLRELAKLQDEVPPAPWDQVRQQIETEFQKPFAEIFLSFDEKPLAAASLGQVHPAILQDGQKVVVKVQRPGIEPVVETDLEILLDLARLVQEHTSLGDRQDLVEIVEEFTIGMWDELDYRQEGRNADQFRLNFAGEPSLYVPQVHWEYTTRRVLTLERIQGIKIDDVEALDAAGIDRDELATNSARIIIKEVFEDGFFHADPHPGNFAVMEDGRIAAMDFGLVGYLDEQAREDLVRLFVIAVRTDPDEMVDQLIHMGAVDRTVDRPGLRRDIHRLLVKYRATPLAEIHLREVMRDLEPVAYRYRFRLPPEYWLLAKTLVMMEGMGLKLAPDFDMFGVSEPYVRRFVMQWALPQRWGKKVAKSAGDWGDLLVTLPRRIPRLLDQLEEGDWQMTMRLGDARHLLAALDSAVNRLSISIIMASLIFGLSLLVSSIISGASSIGLAAVIIGAMLVIGILVLAYLLSAWRGRR